MSFITVRDTREVTLNTNRGDVIILVKENEKTFNMKVNSSGGRIYLDREELLNALMQLYPECIAYQFPDESEDK